MRTSPGYPQSNGKLERWHKSLKSECIRPGTPLTLSIQKQASDDRSSCLENPCPEGAESSLTENVTSPFQAEPAQNRSSGSRRGNRNRRRRCILSWWFASGTGESSTGGTILMTIWEYCRQATLFPPGQSPFGRRMPDCAESARQFRRHQRLKRRYQQLLCGSLHRIATSRTGSYPKCPKVPASPLGKGEFCG